MLKDLISSKVIYWTLGLASAFAVAQIVLGLALLIVALNALFFGSVVAIGATFAVSIWVTVTGRTGYDRAGQMTLGMAMCWLAAVLIVGSSAWVRIVDNPTSPTAQSTYEIVAISRYVLIIAAILQVTAPDVGRELFADRNRLALGAGALLGIVVAVALTVLQGGS